MRLFTLFAALTTMLACQPRFLETSAEVDAFLSRMDYAAACVGLASNDESLREYTAKKLAEYPAEQVASDCLCAALYDAEAGAWDPVTARGVRATKRDDLAACLEPAVSDDRVEDKKSLLVALGAIAAPAGYETLATMAKATDVTVRAAAVSGLQTSAEHGELLRDIARSDADADVRGAAVQGLKGRTGAESRDVLVAVVKAEDDALVRLKAVEILADRRDRTVDRVLCDAMLEDTSSSVRAAAVEAFRGDKKADNISCLRKRLLTLEDDSEVRKATMGVLASSPSKGAADALCDGIGPFLRMYVKDKIYHEYDGVDIVTHQNNRDYERSYECVTKAMRQGGYSCFARHHLGQWVNTLGGSTSLPLCPGMKRKGE